MSLSWTRCFEIRVLPHKLMRAPGQGKGDRDQVFFLFFLLFLGLMLRNRRSWWCPASGGIAFFIFFSRKHSPLENDHHSSWYFQAFFTPWGSRETAFAWPPFLSRIVHFLLNPLLILPTRLIFTVDDGNEQNHLFKKNFLRQSEWSYFEKKWYDHVFRP